MIELLASEGLPTADLADGDFRHFWGCGKRANPSGAVGLEIHGPFGLLRSLVVARAYRSNGCAKALVSTVESYARRRGLHSIFLLTETAEAYFASLGYQALARREVPEQIRASQEFSSLCPDSATVMGKPLGQSRGIDLRKID